jgi:5-methylcytosine-specific restriction endonuclease McrA
VTPEYRVRISEAVKATHRFRIVPRPCAECGQPMMKRRSVIRCSRSCRAAYLGRMARRDNRQAHDRRRRDRLRNAALGQVPVVPSAIYERDEWRCWLCGDAIPRDVVVPHDLAATVDHVTPISKGGLHTPLNVRAAHFICNSLRGDLLVQVA